MAPHHQRARELMDEFSAAGADPAWLLCDRHPNDRNALRFVAHDGSVTERTYGDLADASRRFAAGLRQRGIGPGDRVATLMGKDPALPAVLLGIWRVGAVYVPLFTAFAADTVRARVEASQARLIVTDTENADKTTHLPAQCAVVVAGAQSGESLASMLASEPLVEQPSRTAGNGAIVHMFTSGTTGLPKAVVHPLAYVAGWLAYLEYGLGLSRDSRYWCAADPGWAYGLYGAIVGPLAAGIPTHLVAGGFDPKRTWDVLVNERITDFAAAPTIYRALRREGVPDPAPSALTRLSSAGEPLTPDVNHWSDRELGLAVHDHYGQTELGMVLGFHHHPEVARPLQDHAMGTPLPGWTAAILEESSEEHAAPGTLGRLVLDVPASPLMSFTGYHGVAEPRARFSPDDRWYFTGDTASVDPDGVYHFSARDDDVIIMAGYRIGPSDVETVLSAHPAVAECAVTAEPDDVRGEVLVAHVVVNDGFQGDDALTAELQRLVKERYAAHAYPRAVHYRDGLPKTPSGKIRRSDLRRRPQQP